MKNRTLKSRLSKAGFIRLAKRVTSPITSTEGTSATVLARKGSHSIWQHPHYLICFIQSGKDNSHAKPYQLKQLKKIKLVLNQINHHE
jgi:hypothetical protein